MQKVKKSANLGTTNNVSGTSFTEYFGGFQYNKDVFQFFPHAQGYVKHTINPSNGASEFDYVYQYKDHLGNIRINYTFDTATSSLRVLEENHYYPFGLKHQENLQPRSIRFTPSPIISNEWVKGVGYAEPPPPMAALVPNSGYQYKYNGKEYQDELGLNLYDYGWRNYDPAIGRWVNHDPLLNELKFHYDNSTTEDDDQDDVYMAVVNDLELGGGIYNTDNLNPYAYGYNNPVSFDDPDGRCPLCVGAILGAAFDYGLQVAGNLADGKDLGDSLTDIDGKSILMSAAAGAIGVGIASKVSKIASVAKKIDKAVDLKNNAKKLETLKKAEARAEKLSKTQRPGKEFTKAGKDAVKEVNKAKNNGKNVCESCKTKTEPAKQSKKGETPSKKETHVDHIDAKSKGGSGTPDNGQDLCRGCNLDKSNN